MNGPLRFHAILSLSFLLLFWSPANAVQLFDKQLDVTDYGWDSNIFGTLQQLADEFRLNSAATVNHITWYGFQIPPTNQPLGFRVRIFSDSANAPMAVPFYDQSLGSLAGTDTGLDSLLGYDIREYTTAMPPVALEANQQYWLTIASTQVDEWVWAAGVPAPPGNDVYFREGDLGSWQSTLGLDNIPDRRVEQAFRLENVPEPASISLTAFMLMFVASGRPNRRGTTAGRN